MFMDSTGWRQLVAPAVTTEHLADMEVQRVRMHAEQAPTGHDPDLESQNPVCPQPGEHCSRHMRIHDIFLTLAPAPLTAGPSTR